MVDQLVPASVEYCNVDPVGHKLLVGAKILPPPKMQLVQVLFTILTLSGAVFNVGHASTILSNI